MTEHEYIPPYEHLVRLFEERDRLFEERDRRYEQRFESQERAVSAALAAAEKAVTAALVAADRAVAKAELASEKRFEGINEFRATLSDQAAQFMTRTESGALIERNVKDIQELKDRINTMQGHGAGVSSSWAILVAAVGLMATFVTVYLALHG